MILKIGVSGKRKINKSDEPSITKSIEDNIRILLTKNVCSKFVGYSSLAIGIDSIFAKVATEVFNMPLVVVLPMPLNEYQKDFNAKDVELLNNLIEAASEVKVVTDFIPKNKEERSEAYFTAGKNIVNKCDEMIFGWDELKPGGTGGTAEIIGYYSEMKNKFPVDYIKVFPSSDDLLDGEICKAFEVSNSQAMKSRDDYKLIWKLAIILGWLAVVLFAANTAFHFKGIINLMSVSLEFILVIVTFFLIIKAKKKDYHGMYLYQRQRAETFRILKHYYHSNVEIKLSDFTSAEDKELSGLVEKINLAIIDRQYTSKCYANYSIKSLIEEQKIYHQNKIVSIGGKFHLFERLNLWIAILFMANLIVHFINAFLELKYPEEHLTIYNHGVTVFLSILLPATYAAFEGVIYFQEWAILKKYSDSAAKSLHESLKQLPIPVNAITDNICFVKQSQTLNLVSSIMLTDNKNWHLILEDKNNYHWVV